MGGIGKTELALQYAHFHHKQKTYKGGICWLDCRGENIGLQIISFAISQFNLQIPKEEDLQTRIKFCWRNWPKGDVLIIFDDVISIIKPPTQLRSFLFFKNIHGNEANTLISSISFLTTASMARHFQWHISKRKHFGASLLAE